MSDFTYEPGLVLDPVTLDPVRSSTITVTPSTGGAPAQVYDLNAQPITLQTNSKGYYPSFRVTGLSVAQLSSGDVALVVPSVEARDSGPQAAAAQTAAQAAQTAAQAAQTSATGAASAAADSAAAAAAAAAGIPGTTVTNNGDGTLTISGYGVVNNGDGTLTFLA